MSTLCLIVLIGLASFQVTKADWDPDFFNHGIGGGCHGHHQEHTCEDGSMSMSQSMGGQMWPPGPPGPRGPPPFAFTPPQPITVNFLQEMLEYFKKSQDKPAPAPAPAPKDPPSAADLLAALLAIEASKPPSVNKSPPDTPSPPTPPVTPPTPPSPPATPPSPPTPPATPATPPTPPTSPTSPVTPASPPTPGLDSMTKDQIEQKIAEILAKQAKTT